MAPSPTNTSPGVKITPVNASPTPSPSPPSKHHHGAALAAALATIILLLIISLSIFFYRLRRRSRFNNEVRRHYFMTYRPRFRIGAKSKIATSPPVITVSNPSTDNLTAVGLRHEHSRKVEAFMEDNPDCHLPKNILPVVPPPPPNYHRMMKKGWGKRKRHTIPRFSQASEVARGKVGEDGLVHLAGEENQIVMSGNLTIEDAMRRKSRPGWDIHPLPLGSHPFVVGEDEDMVMSAHAAAAKGGKMSSSKGRIKREGTVTEGEDIALQMPLPIPGDEDEDEDGDGDGDGDEGEEAATAMTATAKIPTDKFASDTLAALEKLDSEAIDALEYECFGGDGTKGHTVEEVKKAKAEEEGEEGGEKWTNVVL